MNDLATIIADGIYIGGGVIFLILLLILLFMIFGRG